MEFPPFGHLRFYEGVHNVRLNISYSNIQAFTLGEFHKALPKTLDLNWTDERGSPELRGLIARRARVATDRVLVTTGATEANFLANAALLRPRENGQADDRLCVDGAASEHCLSTEADAGPAPVEYRPACHPTACRAPTDASPSVCLTLVLAHASTRTTTTRRSTVAQ